MKWLLAAWLCVWWWALGLVLGVFVNAWMRRLTGGRWGDAFAVRVPRLARLMPWLLIGLVPLALGAPWLYPWAADRTWLAEMTRPAFPALWLSHGFFAARLAVYAIVWWLVTRPSVLASKGRTAAALIAYTLVTSLAAVDLLMSLIPGWYSTAFGLVALSAQALSGAALGAWLASRESRDAPWRDLGNLMLMWLMTWAYLAFMQFLIIWAENLPREIRWFVPRLEGGWQWAGIALVVVQLAVPFVALLFRAVKDRPQRLAKVALLLLAASALDAVWMVVPSVAAEVQHVR